MLFLDVDLTKLNAVPTHTHTHEDKHAFTDTYMYLHNCYYGTILLTWHS